MKGNQFIIIIFSLLLLTLSSGLLFYKNLFAIETNQRTGRMDIDELHSIDLKINSTISMLRKNLNADSSILEDQIARVKELLNILGDLNKSNEDLNKAIINIKTYFDKKMGQISIFNHALQELKVSTQALNPTYFELEKNKVKFSLDKRDFYRECVVDALMYLSFSSNFYENKLVEDRKILGQILNYSSKPNPIILKFANHIDVILKRTKEIDSISDTFNKDNSISEDINLINRLYNESIDAKSQSGENFLIMVFSAIFIYLIAIFIVIFKKMT